MGLKSAPITTAILQSHFFALFDSVQRNLEQSFRWGHFESRRKSLWPGQDEQPLKRAARASFVSLFENENMLSFIKVILSGNLGHALHRIEHLNHLFCPRYSVPTYR